MCFPSIHTSPNRLTGRTARLIRQEVFRLLAFLANTLENDIDFGGLETDQSYIETDIDETLQLDRKDLVIPTCLFRKPVVGKDVSALLIFAEVRQANGRAPSSYSAALPPRHGHVRQ